MTSRGEIERFERFLDMTMRVGALSDDELHTTFVPFLCTFAPEAVEQALLAVDRRRLRAEAADPATNGLKIREVTVDLDEGEI